VRTCDDCGRNGTGLVRGKHHRGTDEEKRRAQDAHPWMKAQDFIRKRRGRKARTKGFSGPGPAVPLGTRVGDGAGGRPCLRLRCRSPLSSQSWRGVLPTIFSAGSNLQLAPRFCFPYQSLRDHAQLQARHSCAPIIVASSVTAAVLLPSFAPALLWTELAALLLL
jgi:hypothetical protein